MKIKHVHNSQNFEFIDLYEPKNHTLNIEFDRWCAIEFSN